MIEIKYFENSKIKRKNTLLFFKSKFKINKIIIMLIN